jgi:hypothetical protein
MKNPNFEATALDPTLAPGADQQVTVSVVNDAIDEDHVSKTARNVEVSVGSGRTPLTVQSGPRFLGRLGDEDRITFDVTLSAPADVPAGEYRLPVRFTYEYEDDRETQTRYFTVRVDSRPRFEVVSTSSRLSVGDRGAVAVTVENVGSEPATEGRLTLTSLDGTLAFGGNVSASRHLGTVDPGEQRRLRFVARATEGARPQAYAVVASATFETPDGDTVSQRAGTVPVTPRPEVRFHLRDRGGRLRVGEQGTVTATIVNRGPRTVTDAVVVLETPSESVRVLEPSYPVGALDPGESTTASFPTRVGADENPGPRPFTLSVRYDAADGRTLTSDSITFQRRVAPEAPPFDLEPVNATVEVDESDRLTVRITNVGDVTYRDVNARFTPRLPFTSEAPESYVPVLRPGQSATLAFEVTVSEDAVASTQALAVNVTAERPDGRTVRPEVVYVPVTVTEQPGATSDVETLVAGAVLVLVILAAAWWWLRA